MQKIKQLIQRGISPVLAIIIIIVVSIIVGITLLLSFHFWEQEQPGVLEAEDKIADWEIYRNEELGYQFKYPSNFLINDDFEDNRITINSEDGVILTIESEILEVSLDEEIEAIVENMRREITQGAAPVTIEYRPYLIDNLNGYLITQMRADIPINTRDYFKIQKGNILYSFIYSYQGYILFENPEDVLAGGPVTEEFKKELQLKLKDYTNVQKIISTFRFVETEDETAGWKTYKNEEYGFEFKYPKLENWRIIEEPQKEELLRLSLFNSETDIIDFNISLSVWDLATFDKILYELHSPERGWYTYDHERKTLLGYFEGQELGEVSLDEVADIHGDMPLIRTRDGLPVLVFQSGGIGVIAITNYWIFDMQRGLATSFVFVAGYDADLFVDEEGVFRPEPLITDKQTAFAKDHAREIEEIFNQSLSTFGFLEIVEEEIVEEKEEIKYPVRWTEDVEINGLEEIDFLFDKNVNKLSKTSCEDRYPSPFDMVKNDKEIKVYTCREYFFAKEEGFNHYAWNSEVGKNCFWYPCGYLYFFERVRSSKKSYIKDFNLKEDWKRLPLYDIFGVGQMGMPSKEEVDNAEILEFENYYIKGSYDKTESILEFVEEDKRDEASFLWNFEITILGWGDYNNDGIEDMLLWYSEWDSSFNLQNMGRRYIPSGYIIVSQREEDVFLLDEFSDIGEKIISEKR